MKINFYSFLVYILLIIGVVGSGSLVIDEIKTGNGCPKVLGIPMCIVILICFIIPFIVHVINKKNIFYFLFTGTAFSIALIASILQFTHNAECPKTSYGTPMCYYSFIIFLNLLIFKVLDLRLKGKHK